MLAAVLTEISLEMKTRACSNCEDKPAEIIMHRYAENNSDLFLSQTHSSLSGRISLEHDRHRLPRLHDVLSWQCLYGDSVQGVGGERAAIQQGQAKGLSRDGDQLQVNRPTGHLGAIWQDEG
jgi:hypothetical protein